jgi:predicted unusual protein kinase regulating ubiquinone biosynthesis (AarF/ABC1/UbiB family)
LLIKLGQYVASRPDLFPPDYIQACSRLRDQAPARPIAELQPTLERCYEGRVSSHLAWIEQTPLASASFGQVHRARTTAGVTVAVKIQYPDLAPAVATDLILTRIALWLFGCIFPGWPLHLIGEEITRTSREEQDYLHEGLAADRLRPILAKRGLRVPLILWEHTRESILVMEFADASTLAATDLATLSDVERSAIASRVVDAWLDMLLEAGLVHGDPHAGNILRADDGTLWVIDFGMTVEVGPTERQSYRRFLISLSREDVDGMVDALEAIGVLVPGADRAALRTLARDIFAGLGSLSPLAFKGSQRQTELAGKVLGFLSSSQGIVFPRHTVVLSRALSLVEGLCLDLVPGRNILDIGRNRLGKLVSARAALHDSLGELQVFWRRLRLIPDRIDEIAAKRQSANAGTPLLGALLLIAAVQLPSDGWRMTAAVAAGLAIVSSLLRR